MNSHFNSDFYTRGRREKYAGIFLLFLEVKLVNSKVTVDFLRVVGLRIP